MFNLLLKFIFLLDGIFKISLNTVMLPFPWVSTSSLLKSSKIKIFLQLMNQFWVYQSLWQLEQTINYINIYVEQNKLFILTSPNFCSISSMCFSYFSASDFDQVLYLEFTKCLLFSTSKRRNRIFWEWPNKQMTLFLSNIL